MKIQSVRMGERWKTEIAALRAVVAKGYPSSPPIYYLFVSDARAFDVPWRRLTSPQACLVSQSETVETETEDRTAAALFVHQAWAAVYPAIEQLDHLTWSVLEVLRREKLPGIKIELPDGAGGHGLAFWLPAVLKLAWQRQIPMLRAEKLVAITYLSITHNFRCGIFLFVEGRPM